MPPTRAKNKGKTGNTPSNAGQGIRAGEARNYPIECSGEGILSVAKCLTDYSLNGVIVPCGFRVSPIGAIGSYGIIRRQKSPYSP